MLLLSKRPVVLMILDGFGIGRDEKGNAVKEAKKPVLDEILNRCPVSSLEASGLDVGLPKGQIGNSEVGHTNIGAGRIVYQNLVRINKDIESGKFFSNEAFLKAVQNCRKNSSKLHVLGLLSDGGVHSHINHLFALLEFFKRENLKKIYLHIFTDGRDVLPTSAAGQIEKLKAEIKRLGVGKIATVSGRFYAMDRDSRWDRVKKAYEAIVEGKGEFCDDVVAAVKNSYEKGITDEFIEPFVCCKDSKVDDGDSIIFFNFRPDRARELTKAIKFSDFEGFERKRVVLNVFFVCMTQYDESFKDVCVAYKPEVLKNSFGEYISKKGLTQLRIAETEKYAHVTFFFNAGIEEPFKGEDRVLIKSPDVKTYDLKPEMSAYEVAKEVVLRIKSLKYDVVVVNFANCDMVGHTGVFQAAKKAVEAVDCCVGKVLKAVKDVNGILLITADHGNAEKMLDEQGNVLTSHTTNPVVFAVVFEDCKLKKTGRLCDIAPTMLHFLGLLKPEEMTGENLVI